MLDTNGFNVLVQSKYGPLLVNKNDWPIGTSLMKYGEYAMEELEFLKKIIQPEDVVIDAGANIGTHTVWFSKLAKLVISIEPQRIAHQTLCANVALNHCLNVHTIHAAVGKQVGDIIVPVRDQNQPNNFGGVPLAGITEGERTSLMTIDSLNLPKCDLLKADVEGMEDDLLTGALETISKFRPILYLEADGAQAPDAIRRLFNLGYNCYWHIPNLYNPHNFAGVAEDVFLKQCGNPIVSINILCIPVERHIEVVGLDAVTDPHNKPPMRMHFDMRDELSTNYYNQILEVQNEKELEHV